MATKKTPRPRNAECPKKQPQPGDWGCRAEAAHLGGVPPDYSPPITRLSSTFPPDDEPTTGDHLHRRLQPVPRPPSSGSAFLAVARPPKARPVAAETLPAPGPDQVFHDAGER